MPRRTAVAAAEPPPRRPRRKATTQSVQSAVEGVEDTLTGEVVEDPRKIEFMGEYFLMAEKVGLMPLLKFAHASSRGLDSTDMEGLAALYDMIQDCIDQTVPTEKKYNRVTEQTEETPVGPSEWQRFERHAVDSKAEAPDLMTLVQRVIERLAARPTLPPGDSSAGRQKTSANSKARSFSPVTKYPGLAGMEDMMSVEDLDR